MRNFALFALLCAATLNGTGRLANAQTFEGSVNAGAYLAARQALTESNYKIAANYLNVLLETAAPDGDLAINAILSHTALGEWTRAAEIAQGITSDNPSHELADLAILVVLLAQGDTAAAFERIDADRGAGALVDDLIAGWLYLAQGQMDRASDRFNGLAQGQGLGDLAFYHLALARGAVGDFEGAAQIYEGVEFNLGAAGTRILQAYAQTLVQLDRAEDALEMLDGVLSQNRDLGLSALRDEIAANPERSYDFITTPQQGLAEVFFTLAEALGRESGPTLPLIYSRAAHYIDPSHSESLLLSGDLLMQSNQYDLAIAAYGAVPGDDPLALEAIIGRSDAYAQLGRSGEAIASLQALVAAGPQPFPVHAQLGDLLRREERFAEGADAYSAALALIDQNDPRFWFLFYARGICYEQSDQWDAAEADFRKALSLSPDQSSVLNYLGYSLVEQRRNLDEALNMIERAVELDPDSGYIVDSLAWVYFRLGRYQEAVAPMERAAELLPTDPIVNDHLGDVYWKVGRQREARFQWERALSFDPTEEDAARIRLKLEIGLDEVQQREANSP
ncbi:tetratricopeptide repeat protein [Rhodobacteraceae bacterium XHP0102]|nr:tetratricopeptide repeat protein [Rhodobacteraceae bacterium XHP0102]